MGKAEELSEIFSKRNRGDDGDGGDKFALAIMQDADGDFALIKVRGDGDLKLLGWMKDRECAEELARVINLIGTNGATCSIGTGKDIEEAFRNGIRKSGLH